MVVLSSPAKLSALKRFELIRHLSELPLTQLGQLEFALSAPNSVMPGLAAPVGERAKALLDWAEGPTGVGLEIVYEMAQRMIPMLSSSKQVDAVDQSMAVCLVITLAGDADKLQIEELLSLINELRDISKSSLLEIMRVESNAGIRFVVQGNPDALNHIQRLHLMGHFRRLLNRPVLSVDFGSP